MAKQEDFILIPGTEIRLYDGTVVELLRLPNLQWILHNGFYNYNGRRRKGWYFSSIPAQSEMPVFEEDLVHLRVLDGPVPPCPPGPGPFPPGPVPPCPPVPPGPVPIPYTSRDKKQVQASMITLADIEERDKFGNAWLVDGKVVRVNDSDGKGNPEYYSWNSKESRWDLASLGYRYMTREEIENAIADDIVAITWADENGALVVTNHGGTKVAPIQLTGVAHDPVFTQEELTLTIPIYGKPDFKMIIPRDKYITAIRFEPEWEFSPEHIGPAIVVTVSDGVTSYDIAGDASAMVNIYRGGETLTTKVTISSESSVVTADVKLSAILDNPLKIDNEGLWVDLSGVVGKKDIHAGYLLVADGNGEFTYGGSGIELNTSTAIADLTDPDKKVVTANLIADAISAAIEALRINLEGRIAQLENRMTLFDERLSGVEGRVTKVENRLSFDSEDEGEILIVSGDNAVGSGYRIGGSELNTESMDTVATEEAMTKALSWKSLE